MKFFIGVCFFVLNLYAVPPCDVPEQEICIHVYNQGLVAEMIIYNYSHDDIKFIKGSACLDGMCKGLGGLKVSKHSNYTLHKKFYKLETEKPRISFDYTYSIIK
jgi:hypothetical protein